MSSISSSGSSASPTELPQRTKHAVRAKARSLYARAQVARAEAEADSERKPTFSCSACGKKFFTAQALGGHQNAHRWMKPSRKRKNVYMMKREESSSSSRSPSNPPARQMPRLMQGNGLRFRYQPVSSQALPTTLGLVSPEPMMRTNMRNLYDATYVRKALPLHAEENSGENTTANFFHGMFTRSEKTAQVGCSGVEEEVGINHTKLDLTLHL